MKYEKSCGVIPFIIVDNNVLVLIIKQNNDVVGFPKGHTEPNESEEETAIRECLEETGLRPSIVEGSRLETSYYMPEYDAQKTVVFFVGIVKDINFRKQDSEISDIQIVSVTEAFNRITFDDTKKLLFKALEFLKQE